MNKPIPTQIGLRELRTNLTYYTKVVQKGKTITVFNHNQPVFKVTPITKDPFGDEGNWQTLIDFTEINPNGVALEEVLKSLEKLNERD